jgi:ABC-type sugar transport system ATPase subunit
MEILSQGLSLQMKGINKHFPGVHALKNVDFNLEQGEIHGLLGENGAGKSTLMKVLSGVELMDSGEIYINGQIADIKRPMDSQMAGISFIHQELSLFLHLDIATNIFIKDLPATNGLIKKKELNLKTRKLLEEVGLGQHNPSQLVKNLQMGERQLVEIVRCLSMDTKILVLDEPTSSLTKKEVSILFGLMENLKKKGISIIFITHRLDEVFDICDRITVMRDGEIIKTNKTENTSTSEIVSLMIGRKQSEMYKRERMPRGKELLSVNNLSRGERFENVSFSVYEGEIVGLYGLMGSGRSEIVRSIFGLDSFDSGEIMVNGVNTKIHDPLDAIRNGIGLITENRREEGLMVQQTVQFNLVAASLDLFVSKPFGFMNLRQEEKVCKGNISKLNIKTSSLRKKVQNLSGGNQQKVVIAKWLNRAPKILFLDEPTRGVDVGAKYEIYQILEDQLRQRRGVFVISSELNEIIGLCDRILVIRKGRIVREFSQEEFVKEDLLEACMGGVN